MYQIRRPGRWAILSLILLLVSGIATGYLWQQIRQTEAEFPPTTTTYPLNIDQGYGVTLDATFYSEADLTEALNAMQSARLTWVRIPIRWSEVEPEPGQLEWQALDLAVDLANIRGFNIIAVLDTSPVWARPENTPPTSPPTEVADFGDFARQIAQRYGQRIDYYQIWHEPNLSQNWGDRHVEAAQYVLLLKNAAINIRAIDAEAQIITAALAPTSQTGPLNLNEIDYLNEMYAAQAGPWFDILGAQLYGFHLPVTPVENDPQILSIHRVRWLRAVMEANDDGHKPVWATAFGWHALPPDWAGQPTTWPSDTSQVQQQRTAEAIDYARANWPWLGPMLAVRWDGTDLAAGDPGIGFAINPNQLAPFTEAGTTKVDTAEVGRFPATHRSGIYSAGWRFGRTQADVPLPSATDEDEATLTITFEGTRLDLNINRNLYRGYLRVTIDDAPSKALPKDEDGRSYVVLYDPLQQAAEVTVSRFLSDGPHTAVIEADGGWGQWAISGWTVYREGDTRSLRLGLGLALTVVAVSLVGLVWDIRRQRPQIEPIAQRWGQTISDLVTRLETHTQLVVTAILILAFYLLPGPIALLLLPVIAVLFYLRPKLGLMALSFGISFFLARKSLPVGTFSVLELGFALLAMVVIVRLLVLALRRGWLSLLAAIRLRPTDMAALLLLGLAIIATLTALNFGVSMFELRTLIIGSVGFYFLIRIIPWLEQVNRESLALQLADAFIAGATLHAAFALYQYLFEPGLTIEAEGVRRALGYLYGSPNNLSLFLDRAFPILFALVIFGRGLQRRVLYGLALAIVSAALILTFSKGALLIAVPATILFFALFRGGRTGWLGAGSGLILLGVALIPISRTERFQSTFSLQPGSTTFFRLKVWQSGWQMLTDYPLTGVGLDNFLYQYRTRYILPEAWEEPNLSHPHNLFLDFGTRLGVVGILILLWLLWQFWSGVLRCYTRVGEGNTKALLLGLMGSMLAFFTHGLIDNAYFLVDLAYTFFLSLGIVEMLKDG